MAIHQNGFDLLEDLQNNYFKLLEFEVVLYDEIETFRDFDQEQFHYPYGPRKTSLNRATIDIQLLAFEIQEYGDYEYNYEYLSSEINFQQSSVCLESTFYEDFLDLGPTIVDLFFFMIGQNKDHDRNKCNSNKLFNKIKYSSYTTKEKSLYDDYGRNVVKGKILFEFIL